MRKRSVLGRRQQSGSAAAGPLDPAVLSELLALPARLQAADEEQGVAECAVAAFSRLPGVSGCLLCLRGNASASIGQFGRPVTCQREPVCRRTCCRVGPAPGRWVHLMESGSGLQGILATALHDEAAFEPYQQHADNAAVLISLHVEKLRMSRDLSRLNSALAGQIAEHAAAERGRQEQILSLRRDLNTRVRERTTELQYANSELEAFSYSVSHDLREPLRAVEGFSVALMEDFGPQLPEEAWGFLRSIRSGAHRMETLINDLLEFSRLTRKPLSKRSLNTTSLVNSAVAQLAPLSSGRDIEFRIDDLPACRGDGRLLKQVWINLLSNAIKYTRYREKATIEVGSRHEHGEWCYFVRDNGAGFDMRHAGRLFGVFQRLHRVDEFEGTGVGLAIADRIVRRHGGRIWAHSEPDRGATFWFTLEAKRPATRQGKSR